MSSVNQRVQRHRDRLRKAGLRLVQLWVPDTRRPGFAAECERQCRIANEFDVANGDLDRVVYDAMTDMGDWTA